MALWRRLVALQMLLFMSKKIREVSAVRREGVRCIGNAWVSREMRETWQDWILCSLHWLKITERIEYKVLSLTYKVLTTTQPSCLHHLISVQPPRSTCSSSLVTITLPPTSSLLRITDRSFRYASACLWNQLSSSLRKLHTSSCVSTLRLTFSCSYHIFSLCQLSILTVRNSLSFTSGLRHTSFTITNLSHHRLPSGLRIDSTDFITGPFLLSISVFMAALCYVIGQAIMFLLCGFFSIFLSFFLFFLD